MVTALQNAADQLGLLHADVQQLPTEIRNTMNAKITEVDAAIALAGANSVPLAGGTMTGALNLPAGGLNVGSGQFEVDALGRVRKPNTPRFRAFAGGSYGGPAAAVWSSAILNIGSHFDVANGRFTAPIEGTFAFILRLLSGNDTAQLDAVFRLNGLHESRARAAKSSTVAHETVNIVSFYDLADGDYVDVWIDGGNVYGSAHYWSEFSGIMM